MSESSVKKISSVYTHIFPIFLFFALEIQNTGQVLSNPAAMAFTCVLIYLSFMVLTALTGRASLSGFIVTLTLIVFYTVSFYRRTQTGQVLLPIDLNFTKHLKSMAAFSNLRFEWRSAVSILAAALLNVPLFRMPKAPAFDLKKRAGLFIGSGLLLFLIFFTRFSKNNLLQAMDLGITPDDSYNEIYGTRSALLGFYLVGVSGDAEKPESYSPEHIGELLSKVTETGEEAAAVKPNVIVVMSESFWDPTRLPHVEYSEDPVPNLHRLSDITASGNLISPVFGGLTCNAEFEFLTGNSMKYTGYGDIPYYESETYIDHDGGRALPSMFKENGYQTVALHTYMKTFFDRDKHYPKLGFDTFIAEEDMPEAHMKGAFHGQEIISDEYFYDKLIETVEASEDNGPLFLFGITMQNHTPYLPDKYEYSHIKADSSGILSNEDTAYLESYLEGVNDADQLLGKLHDYVEQTETPTILVYFGDHLPYITQSTGVYQELGYFDREDLTGLTPEEAYKMYTTPYLVYSNYKDIDKNWGDLSPYFLGALLADEAGIETNNYYKFLLQAFGSFQAMNRDMFMADGVIQAGPDENDSVLEMFENFQYDKLFGEGYGDRFLSSFLSSGLSSGPEREDYQ